MASMEFLLGHLATLPTTESELTKTDKLFEGALKLVAQWIVAEVDFKATACTLTIKIDFVPGRRKPVPAIGGPCRPRCFHLLATRPDQHPFKLGACKGKMEFRPG